MKLFSLRKRNAAQNDVFRARTVQMAPTVNRLENSRSQVHTMKGRSLRTVPACGLGIGAIQENVRISGKSGSK